MTHIHDKQQWEVKFSSKAAKQFRKLPADMQSRLYALRLDLEDKGPEQTSWRNYSLIVGAKNVHHCHLNSGRPRYVVVWKVTDTEVHIIEIRYVGPHGSVNYKLFT
ncbi:MAG: cytotoxic translational repressor of toxin-antitoxin stability system [Pseudomonadota bacterium]